MNAKLASAKRFVSAHRVAIAVTATTAVCVALNQMALRSHNDFLKEKNLYDEYYTPDAD